MKNRILIGWNFMRALRLGVGLLILAQGVLHQDWAFVMMGGFFASMPLFNIGCCGTASCNINVVNKDKTSEDITYEEVC